MFTPFSILSLMSHVSNARNQVKLQAYQQEFAALLKYCHCSVSFPLFLSFGTNTDLKGIQFSTSCGSTTHSRYDGRGRKG